MSERYYLADMEGKNFMAADGTFCPREDVDAGKLMLSFASPQDADNVSDFLKRFQIQVKPMPLADSRHPDVIYRPDGPFNRAGERMGPHPLNFASSAEFVGELGLW
jgi:hypothetical protein